jgi:DNA-directed RNA polymerase specialized sigma24 family protein
VALAEELGSDDRWRILEEQRPRLLRLLVNRGTPLADAEDCVQETLLRASLLTSVDERTVRALLTTIAVNLATDVHRREARARRLHPRLLPGAGASPDEIALDRFAAASAVESARSLSTTERAVLSDVADGFRPREIASRMGVPAKTVHLALYRARKSLRALGGGLAILVGLRRALGRVVRPLAPTTVGLTAVTLLMSMPGATLGPAPMPPSADLPAIHAGIDSLPAAVPVRPLAVPGGPAATPRPPRASAAPPTVRSTTVWVNGPGGVIQGPVTVEDRNHGNTFQQALVACLQPGAISLDPAHAGCDR